MSSLKNRLCFNIILLLLCAVAVFILLKTDPFNVDFTRNYQGDITTTEGQQELRKVVADNIRAAREQGAIRFEGGNGLTEDNPVIISMDFPERKHSLDLNEIIRLYVEQQMPDARFHQVHYEVSKTWLGNLRIEPLDATYSDATGQEKTLYYRADFALDKTTLLAILLPILAVGGMMMFRRLNAVRNHG